MSAGFQFKQFFVAHDRCAMKVGTDSILLGSWTSIGSAKRLLDVGSGSGLLTLMMAQRAEAEAQLVGIEMDLDACRQARQNAAASPWHTRIAFYQMPIQEFQSAAKFDLIVSNPPYFVPKIGQLDTDDPQYISDARRAARHTILLDAESFFAQVERLLNSDGRCSLVVPFADHDTWITHAKNIGLYCYAHLQVASKPGAAAKRSLLAFSFIQTATQHATLTIHGEDGGYSPQFRGLCRDYYLNF